MLYKEVIVDKLRSMLDGKKTYLVSAGIVLAGVGAFLQGETDLVGLVAYVLNGTGLATLRAGVSKSGD